MQHAATLRRAISSRQDTIRSRDSLRIVAAESDTLAEPRDTASRRKAVSGLDKMITGHATDSLFYDLRNNKVYIYEKGDVTYDNMNLQADYMNIDLDQKSIYAYGKTDSVDGEVVITRPLFTQGETSLNMDTITYNIETERAKIKGIATQQGDGWLIGHDVKRMEDNTIHIADGMYTTCDETDHPHFYYYMSKAKVIPGDKGKVIEADNENMFAIVEFSAEAMKELKSGNLENPLPSLELGVKRPGFQGTAGEFIGRIRLRQEVKGKNYVVCDILGSWEQDKVKDGDVIFAD